MTRETKLLIDMWDILHRECHKVVTEENYDAIKKSIKALEQEPKTGHWITWKEADNVIPSETRFECSVCHDAAHTLCNGLDLLSSYCPNCGAKMIEQQETETWNGIHTQITAPKGTFDRLFNEAEDDNDI